MNLRGQLPGSVQKAKGTDKEIRTFLCGEAAEATGHQRLGCPQLSLGGTERKGVTEFRTSLEQMKVELSC